MHYKAIIFDFDGTLVISNQIKIDVYFDVFKNYNIDYQLIKNILKQYPELNRYETIGKIIEKSDKDLDALFITECYSTEVQNRIQKCDNLKHAEELLKYLYNHQIKTFLSSNTPEVFIIDLIKERGWIKYFHSIHGYPDNKIDTVKNLLHSYDFKLNEIVVIGDGSSDKESASFNGIKFIKVESNSLLPIIKKLGIKYSIIKKAISFTDKQQYNVT